MFDILSFYTPTQAETAVLAAIGQCSGSAFSFDFPSVNQSEGGGVESSNESKTEGKMQINRNSSVQSFFLLDKTEV